MRFLLLPKAARRGLIKRSSRTHQRRREPPKSGRWRLTRRGRMREFRRRVRISRLRRSLREHRRHPSRQADPGRRRKAKISETTIRVAPAPDDQAATLEPRYVAQCRACRDHRCHACVADGGLEPASLADVQIDQNVPRGIGEQVGADLGQAKPPVRGIAAKSVFDLRTERRFGTAYVPRARTSFVTPITMLNRHGIDHTVPRLT